jgi:predicted DNA-binding transcriptional regulator YafY
MRASRLLSIQMLLQTRGRMSARTLADALKISVRTLYRDVDQLSSAGVPIYAERGRSGGFQLMEGWRTTLTGFTPSEAQAVFLSGLRGPAADLGLADQVQAAQLKLLTSLPTAWREDAQRIGSRLHLDPIEWYREAEPVPHLATAASAVWHERQLKVRYKSWTDATERVVHPLGLVLKAGAWYLVAAFEGKARTYRVSNILAATALDAPAMRPRRFDLPAYWSESIRRFERELYTGHAVLLATPAGLEGLRYLSSAVAKAVADAAAPRRRDGRVKLKIPIESIEHATGQLLRLAPGVEVIEPASLRRATVDLLRRIGDLYGVVPRNDLHRSGSNSAKNWPVPLDAADSR